ncbi:hypothetical protein AOXY_G7276 [Acipenser oxyrinchus oxyrinchus]|uniref:Kinesin motor domain-containing protein n=1 Tax=Acipenser oxyrinchus oxyrinchus TaxID=40147 RepID=A0AAD8LMT8_ACIOX|nr:hypothetical protein AOXY_G7276 [Acipenser oxyrinchus oxyrinchus]
MEYSSRAARFCVLSGCNGTIFAYGQMGSGKTFTITGGAEQYSDRGMTPHTPISSISSRRTALKSTQPIFLTWRSITNVGTISWIQDMRLPGWRICCEFI